MVGLILNLGVGVAPLLLHLGELRLHRGPVRRQAARGLRRSPRAATAAAAALFLFGERGGLHGFELPVEVVELVCGCVRGGWVPPALALNITLSRCEQAD